MIPAFEEKLKDETIHCNSTLILMVKVKGFPEPLLKWYKNSVEIFESDRCIISREGFTYTMKIDKISESDGAFYSAVAKSSVGEAVTNCNVQVQGEKGKNSCIKHYELFMIDSD